MVVPAVLSVGSARVMGWVVQCTVYSVLKYATTTPLVFLRVLSIEHWEPTT